MKDIMMTTNKTQDGNISILLTNPKYYNPNYTVFEQVDILCSEHCKKADEKLIELFDFRESPYDPSTEAPIVSLRCAYCRGRVCYLPYRNGITTFRSTSIIYGEMKVSMKDTVLTFDP